MRSLRQLRATPEDARAWWHSAHTHSDLALLESMGNCECILVRSRSWSQTQEEDDGERQGRVLQFAAHFAESQTPGQCLWP